MSEDTATAAAPPLVNGSAPAPGAAPEAAPCEDCATNGERALAVLAGLIGLFVIGMAVDMFTGGAVSRMLGRAEVDSDGG